MAQDINELSKAVKLRARTTKEAVELLTHDILIALYRRAPEAHLKAVVTEQGKVEVQKKEVTEALKEASETTAAFKQEIAAIPNSDTNDFYTKQLSNYQEAQTALEEELAGLFKKSVTLKKAHKQASELAEFNVALNGKIAKAYEEKYGKKFNIKIHEKNKELPLFLMGPPGQGKTASYTAAAKEACAMLELNFVENITDSYIPSREDFIMVVQECAGENSAITFGGIPRAEEVKQADGSNKTVLKKAINYRFTVFDECAGGVLLFDDAANAPSVIQNVLLPVAQNKSFQGLKIKNALIGFTGNLGALDGTHTAELSSALLTRTVPCYITDDVKDFCNRAYAFYNDELSDMGYTNFLLRNPKDFAALPDPGQKSGFPCSRSHDNIIQQIRSAVERNGGRGVGEEKSLEDIRNIATSCLGLEVGLKVVSYYDSYMRGADPLAKQYVVHGNPNPEKLKQEYDGGSSPEAISFGYQFATACGDYGVSQIGEAQNPREALQAVVKKYGKAILQLGDSEYSYALEHFKTKLAAYVTDFSIASANKRELNPDIREKIAETIVSLEDCSQSKRDITIAVITDMDKFAKTSVFGAKVGGSRKLSNK